MPPPIQKTGPFKSCLIPHKEFIFTSWYIERKPAREIQRTLAEQYGIKVAISTITRFIRVRRERPEQ
ncbi:hypothetical protein SDC9_204593 [bioreactor metagenome]|uniref:Uncharacterized protein n=1 Tax=bioreactor metagenome TaxID=1076179 RepID=A0A645J159_9ZZZZ